MLHTVYKTTNLVNGNYYFGYHKTKDPQDDYLGSGKYLRSSIAKYGAVNFKKDVLFVYLDAVSAFGKEAELVDSFRCDPLCMNLRQGGSGGFDYINTHLPTLIGQTFGRLYVISSHISDKNNQRQWVVRCDCGTIKVARTSDLTHEKIKACGHCWKREDLIGQKFGYLTVLSLFKATPTGCIWLCRCTCGTEKPIKAKSLKCGDAKSCGCLHPKKPTVILGQSFGRLTILARAKNKNQRSRWLVKCLCGTKKEVLGSSLLSGATKSCGCLRRDLMAQLPTMRGAY